MRLVKQTPDHEGPIHPQYPDFNLRRCLRRICHYYHHPHHRHEEVIDVIAIRSVMAAASAGQSQPCVWEDNSPESLFNLASKCILANPGVLFRVVEDEDSMLCEEHPHRMRACFDRIHDGLVLPSEICDHLLQTMAAEGLDIDDRVAQAFSDPTRSKLRRLELRNTHIKTEGFKMLVKHNLRELRIHKCDYLSEEILPDLNLHADQLIELTLDPASSPEPSQSILPTWLPGPDQLDLDEDDEVFEEDKEKAKEYFDQGYILRGPKLQRLTLRDLKVGLGSTYFEFLLKPFPHLSHLDLSGAELRGGFPTDFGFLLVLPKLRSLVLHAVPGIKQEAIDTISKLKHLR